MTTLGFPRAVPGPDGISRLYCYHPNTVPAALQSQGYARAVQAEPRCPARSSLDAGMLDTIDSQHGDHWWAVVELLALRRTPDGDKAAFQEQLRHLLDLSSSRILSLQIIPEVPARPAAAPFTIIRFARPDRSDAVVLDPGRGGAPAKFPGPPLCRPCSSRAAGGRG